MSNQPSLQERITLNFQRRYDGMTRYRVQGGDTLSGIIHNYYGIKYNDAHYAMAIAHVLYFNRAITNPDRIYLGQVIKLPPLPLEDDPAPYCAVNDNVFAFDDAPFVIEGFDSLRAGYDWRLQAALPKNETELGLFWALSWLHQNYDYLNISAGAGFNTWGNLVAQGNQALLNEVKTSYQAYKSGHMTKGQYDYRRRRALKAFADRLGPFEKFVLKGKTGAEAMRISRTKAIPATAKIDFHLSRLLDSGRLQEVSSLIQLNINSLFCFLK